MASEHFTPIDGTQLSYGASQPESAVGGRRRRRTKLRARPLRP